MLPAFIMTIVGFLSGSVMYSYYIPKIFRHIDIRRLSADHNPGSSNAIRYAGVPMGLCCMVLDVLKAFVPVFLFAQVAGPDGPYLIAVLLAPILGHAFSPFLGFKGGKSVSTVFGALLGVLFISRIVFVLAVIMAFFKFIVVIHPDSTEVMVSCAAASMVALVVEPVFSVKVAMVIISFLLLYKLQTNPDRGEQYITIGSYSISIEENRLKLHKL